MTEGFNDLIISNDRGIYSAVRFTKAVLCQRMVLARAELSPGGWLCFSQVQAEEYIT